jgi:hypothetical protein
VRRAGESTFFRKPLASTPALRSARPPHGVPQSTMRGRSSRRTPISQETLAEIIGTTRPRVSLFMNKFGKLGFIEYNGHLEVHSSLVSVLLRE